MKIVKDRQGAYKILKKRQEIEDKTKTLRRGLHNDTQGTHDKDL